MDARPLFRGHTGFSSRSRFIVVVTPGDPAPATFSLEVGFGPRGQEETLLTTTRFGDFTIQLPESGLVSYRYQTLPAGSTVHVALLREEGE